MALPRPPRPRPPDQATLASQAGPAGRRARARPRRAALGMGRAAVVVGRGALWAAVGLVLVRGTLGVVRPAQPATAAPPPPEATFPREAAAAFAARCARAFFDYDAERPAAHAAALVPCQGADADPQGGWDGKGRQSVQAVVVAGIDVIGVRARTRVDVTAGVEVQGGRWLYVAVPVVMEGRALVVAEPPALVAGPARAEAPAEDTALDSTLSSEARPLAESWFRAYAAGSAPELAYLSAGGPPAGLGGEVAFDGLADLRVAPGGERRAARALVRWREPVSGAVLTEPYRLTLVRRDGRWYVAGDPSSTKEHS